MADEVAESSGLARCDNVSFPRTPQQVQRYNNFDKIRDEFARKMGLAFLSWTDCCDVVSIIFDSLTGLDEQTSEVIFKCIRSERTQRELTLDIARIKLHGHPDLLSVLERLLKDLENLASKRNLIAHHSFALHADKDFNARMKPMSEYHPWSGKDDIDSVLESLIESLRRCDQALFDLSMKISERLGTG